MNAIHSLMHKYNLYSRTKTICGKRIGWKAIYNINTCKSVILSTILPYLYIEKGALIFDAKKS